MYQIITTLLAWNPFFRSRSGSCFLPQQQKSKKILVHRAVSGSM